MTSRHGFSRCPTSSASSASAAILRISRCFFGRASAGLLFTLRELSAASRRFDDFVRELQPFNRKAHRRAGNLKEDLD